MSRKFINKKPVKLQISANTVNAGHALCNAALDHLIVQLLRCMLRHAKIFVRHGLNVTMKETKKFCLRAECGVKIKFSLRYYILAFFGCRKSFGFGQKICASSSPCVVANSLSLTISAYIDGHKKNK